MLYFCVYICRSESGTAVKPKKKSQLYYQVLVDEVDLQHVVGI